MSSQATVERLIELGFTQYEAQAYLGMLGAPPMTGYALSNLTGIPQPKVYETLRRLARKGVAVSLEGKPTRFAALPPQQMLAQLDVSFRRRLADAEVGLMREFGTDKEEPRVLATLRDWPLVERHALELLEAATRHVYVSINCDEPTSTLAALCRLDERGIRSDVLSFDKEPLQLRHGRVVRHVSTEGVVYRHHQARHLAIVADGSKVLWALAPDGSDWEAMVADDPLLAAAIKGYVRHDIYVQLISEDFGELLEARYGPALGALVEVVRDEQEPAAGRGEGRRRSRTA